MTVQPIDIPRAEALKYLDTWKNELELRQKEIYSRLFGGAMGGIATIVLSAGLALDKLAQAGWLIRLALALALFLLLLGAGNIMNCFRVAVDGQLLLLAQERDITLSQAPAIPVVPLQQVGAQLSTAVASVQQFYAYSYFSIAGAVLVGAITFFVSLFLSK